MTTHSDTRTKILVGIPKGVRPRYQECQ